MNIIKYRENREKFTRITYRGDGRECKNSSLPPPSLPSPAARYSLRRF